MSCSIKESTENGIKFLHLENDILKITVLVGKGSEIYEIIFKEKDMDILLKVKDGLSQYKGRNLYEKPLTWYSELFTGGWMDVVPDKGIYKDVEIKQENSGVAATMPWDYQVLKDTDEEIKIKCFVKLPLIPLLIEKEIGLKEKESKVYIKERLKNVGDAEAKFTWTQHCAFGGGFLDENVFIGMPTEKAFRAWDYTKENGTDEEMYEENINSVTLDKDTKINLLRVRPNIYDEQVFVTIRNLKEAKFTMFNEKKGIGFSMTWDKVTFPYLRYWYRNSKDTYTVAIEPSNTYSDGFKNSLKRDTYLNLLPQEEISTWLECDIFER